MQSKTHRDFAKTYWSGISHATHNLQILIIWRSSAAGLRAGSCIAHTCCSARERPSAVGPFVATPLDVGDCEHVRDCDFHMTPPSPSPCIFVYWCAVTVNRCVVVPVSCAPILTPSSRIICSAMIAIKCLLRKSSARQAASFRIMKAIATAPAK